MYEKVVLVALRLRVLQVILEQQFLRLLLKRGHIAGKNISLELACFYYMSKYDGKKIQQILMVTMIPIIGTMDLC